MEKQRAWSGQLQDIVSDEDVERLWRGVESRREKRATRKKALQIGSVAMLVIVGGIGIQRSSGIFRAPVDGALRYANGHSLPLILQHSVELSDRSQIAVTHGQLEVVANNGQAFAATMMPGRARFSVTPDGPRHWSVDCDLARVEVVGTVFSIERTQDEVTVHVERGHVRVRSQYLSGQVQMLARGQSLTVRRPQHRPALESHDVANLPQPSETPSLLPAAVEDVARVAREPSRQSLRDVLAAADRARSEGRPEDAANLIEDGLRQAPRDPQRALAVYTLARLQLRDLRNFALAASLFEQALLANLPTALIEEAHLGRIESYARANDTIQATRAAQDFRERVPNSRRHQEVTRWLPSESPR